MKCGACKAIFYCCKEHQKEHWKAHKPTCSGQDHKAQAKKAADMAFVENLMNELGVDPAIRRQMPQVPAMPAASSWSRGFASPSKMYEWLVDCYRMRVDDDYAYGGGNTHGIYNPDADKNTVVADLLIFAKLCKMNDVLPAQGWNWEQFLKAALPLLPYAFEKSDAQEKYGRENVFSGFTGSGRSLRATGEIIYKTSVMGDDESEEYRKVYDQVDRLFEAKDPFKNERAFADVGGAAIWRKFKKDLQFQNGYGNCY